jgi:hypothetical protein
MVQVLVALVDVRRENVADRQLDVLGPAVGVAADDDSDPTVPVELAGSSEHPSTVRPRRRAEVAACTRFGESALTLNTSRADPSRRFELSGVRRARPKEYGEAQQGQHSLTLSDRLAAWKIEPMR